MVRRAVAVATVLVLAALVAPVSAPVSVSFVHSGSMAPTIDEGDGFVLVPAGDLQRGDVITFRSEHRGEYVTHRVVGTTDEGYLTRGDANPHTDQSAGHPPVARDAVVGEVMTVGGHLVVIPGLGVLVGALAAVRGVLIAAALAVGLLFARRSGARPRRPVTTSRELFRALLVVATVGTVALILVGGSTVGVPVAGSDADAGPRAVVLSGAQPATAEFSVSRSPLLAQVVTADGARVVGTERDGTTVAVALDPPTGRVGDQVRVSFYRYPPVLPGWLLVALQRLHPGVAATASVLVAYLPVYGATHLLFGGREPLRSPRWLHRWGDRP